MSYIHLTTTERVKIETYLELGMSRQNPGYVAARAQRCYEKAKSNCGAKTRRTIIEKLRATWSPEQIVGRLYAGKIAFSIIYR